MRHECIFRQTRILGCQMVFFQTKNPNLGKFWRVLQWKMLVCFITVWNILRPFGRFHGHLVDFMVTWYILSSFGKLYQQKSGNPALIAKLRRFTLPWQIASIALLSLGWSDHLFGADFSLFWDNPDFLAWQPPFLGGQFNSMYRRPASVTRGRCYDHNFLRFFLIFGDKIGVFLKYQCYDQLFFKI
jgi:hypothetical protein